MKQIIEFLTMNLGRLLAILLGVTVLPMRWLLGFTLHALVSTLLIIGLTIAAPIITAIILSQTNLSKFYLIPISLVIGPVVSVFLAIIFLAQNAISWNYLAVNKVFEYIVIGFSRGLVDGLDGFIQAWNEQSTPWTATYQSLRVFFSRMAGPLPQQEENPAGAFDRLRLVLGDVEEAVGPNRGQANPDIVIKNPGQGSEPLSNEEINQFQQLLDSNRGKAPKLSILFERYKTLSTSLNKAQRYLLSKQAEEGIEDELIVGCEVNSPIFFFKQYNYAGSWHSVPASGYITDEQSLRTWLQNHNTHPLTRDPITQSSPYKLNNQPYETRYRYHELTAENCSVQELREGAEKIREVLAAGLEAVLPHHYPGLSAFHRTPAERTVQASQHFPTTAPNSSL